MKNELDGVRFLPLFQVDQQEIQLAAFLRKSVVQISKEATEVALGDIWDVEEPSCAEKVGLERLTYAGNPRFICVGQTTRAEGESRDGRGGKGIDREGGFLCQRSDRLRNGLRTFPQFRGSRDGTGGVSVVYGAIGAVGLGAVVAGCNAGAGGRHVVLGGAVRRAV